VNTALHFSSASDEWETPGNLFEALDFEFAFTLDGAASADNAKCTNYHSLADSGLTHDWQGERVWLNPPYSQIDAWVEHAATCHADLVVMLIPSRTDTKRWHRYIWDNKIHKPRPGVEVRFIEGRIKFGGHTNSAPFPSAIIVFRHKP